MEPQVEFFHHASASDSLIDQSEATAAVVAENLLLRQENQRLLEQFCQQIHDIQREKETVRLRLIAVESDYDAQMRELQAEIMNLREEVQQQKRRSVQKTQEHEAAVQSLCEHNAALQKKLDEANQSATETSVQMKEMQQHLHTARAAIQSHVQQIESLRAEINHLKEDRATLEQKLQAIIDERDCLLTTLSDAQQANALLQQENVNQQLVITCQDNELAQLQEAAALLKDQIQTLNSAASPSRKATSSAIAEKIGGQTSTPHQSLMGELSAANSNNAEDNWWYKHVQLDPSMMEFYEDDGIEIDDASLLAAMVSNGRVLLNSEEKGVTKTDMKSNFKHDASAASSFTEEEFLGDFRTEVAEIYQQLRQMCVEVSAQSSTNASSATDHRPGSCCRSCQGLGKVKTGRVLFCKPSLPLILNTSSQLLHKQKTVFMDRYTSGHISSSIVCMRIHKDVLVEAVKEGRETRGHGGPTSSHIHVLSGGKSRALLQTSPLTATHNCLPSTTLKSLCVYAIEVSRLLTTHILLSSPHNTTLRYFLKAKPHSQLFPHTIATDFTRSQNRLFLRLVEMCLSVTETRTPVFHDRIPPPASPPLPSPPRTLIPPLPPIMHLSTPSFKAKAVLQT
ncbi:BICD family-like cargo adapter 1 [Taenia crassiceps]|uniref:BICD family-like cargo adapter 1 n=1 Tax=Taenia crassiceps TaxID=6207 RepID=A0ABR4QFL2_9CEST